jgi:hypothetical protein
VVRWPAACTHVLLVYAYAFRPLYPIFTIFVSSHAIITVNNALVSIPRVVDQEDCTFFCLMPTCSKLRRPFGHVDCRLFCVWLLSAWDANDHWVWSDHRTYMTEAILVCVLICGWIELCTFFCHVYKFRLYPSEHLPSQWHHRHRSCSIISGHTSIQHGIRIWVKRINVGNGLLVGNWVVSNCSVKARKVVSTYHRLSVCVERAQYTLFVVHGIKKKTSTNP